MSRQLVIAGAGEHAAVVAEAAAAAGWQLAGWVGPAAAPGAIPELGVPWLGTDEEHAVRLAAMDPEERPALVLGFGGAAGTRRRAVEQLGSAITWATIVHPAAWVSPSATLGSGSVVLAGAVVNTRASIGAHAIVNSGAVVEHDVQVGDHAHIGPGAAIGGGASVGEDAFIGLNASVRDHVSVGDGVTVGMGSAVVADVPPGALVTGVPARTGAVDTERADG